MVNISPEIAGESIGIPNQIQTMLHTASDRCRQIESGYLDPFECLVNLCCQVLLRLIGHAPATVSSQLLRHHAAEFEK
jgi:hypothetical protein